MKLIIFEFEDTYIAEKYNSVSAIKWLFLILILFYYLIYLI